MDNANPVDYNAQVDMLLEQGKSSRETQSNPATYVSAAQIPDAVLRLVTPLE